LKHKISRRSFSVWVSEMKRRRKVPPEAP